MAPHPQTAHVSTIELAPNIRRFPGDVDGLAKLLDASGWVAPLQVTELPGERYALQAGSRRWAAIQILRAKGDTRWDYLPIQVIDPDRVQDIQLQENYGRESLRPIETAYALDAYRKQGLNQYQIAKRTGMSTATVYRYMQVADLHADVRQQLENGNNALTLLELVELSKRDPFVQLALFKRKLAGAPRGKGRRSWPEQISELIAEYKAQDETDYTRGAIDALTRLKHT